MEKFETHRGACAPLFEANIDTDQIIPKKFLLHVGRSGFSKGLFYDWRYDQNGEEKSDFVLNDPKYDGATILIGGANFGCGSSREHAPWALLEYGFRVIIAPSFADIFYNNCLKTGILPIVLSEPKIKGIIDSNNEREEYFLEIDLRNRSISDGDNFSEIFELDDFRQYCLLNGFDDIALTLMDGSEITKYEISRANVFMNL